MTDYRDKDLIAACNENPWLADTEYDLMDYRYSFQEASGIDELRDVFNHGNWAIRSGYIYKDLAFVQQVDGGDEWLTLKNENGKWRSFESISFGQILKEHGDEYFSNYMNRLANSTIDQYWGRSDAAPGPKQEADQGVGPTLSM
jgi:hypothetical protein